LNQDGCARLGVLKQETDGLVTWDEEFIFLINTFFSFNPGRIVECSSRDNECQIEKGRNIILWM
jgi:hypothetical protein